MSQSLLSPVPTKVIPRIFGGLGNQLFCYAAARRMALVNHAELVIDNVSGFQYDFEYSRQYQLDNFHIPCRKVTAKERLGRVQRYLNRLWNQYLPFAQRTYVQQEGIDFDSRLLDFKPQGTTYLDGYWQSEDYFKDVEETLRQDLQIKPPTDTNNLSIAAQIRTCTAVAVHVRFFNESHNVLSDYYRCAIEVMEQLEPDAHYFIFSDKTELARTLILLPDDKITLAVNNQGDEHAYADLWLMTQCQHFIIANSTFSWWGAWLAANLDKQVIAPGFKITTTEKVTSWGFKGLLPNAWITL